VVLDFNAQGKVVGIAILNLRAREEIDEPFVVPAKAGTQNVIISDLAEEYALNGWIPAYAGMTVVRSAICSQALSARVSPEQLRILQFETTG
jgi:hypothetical protein